MIDVEDSSAAYYYHHDALGSVVALSDAAGDTVQVYDYSVYGKVAASDEDHTNPFLFTGRRYDKGTGLYDYRARYCYPEIGRFLQTDPVGYSADMNLYRYCRSNPLNMADPFGLAPYFGWIPCDLTAEPNGCCITDANFLQLFESWLAGAGGGSLSGGLGGVPFDGTIV